MSRTWAAPPGVRSSGGPAEARTFRDDALESELRTSGFVIVDLLDDDVLATLSETVDRVYVDDRHGFHASNLSPSHAYRHQVCREVVPVIEPLVVPLLVEHEAYTASVLMKWADDDSAFHSHQDWSMVDESRYRTVNVWCPLVDVEPGNGALCVLPGSHRVLDAIRCSPMPPNGFESAGWEVDWSEMQPIPVRRGQVVVMDHAVLHSSGPNRSAAPRPAVAVAFKPTDAALYHWYTPDPTVAECDVYAIDRDFFADIDIGDPPDAPTLGRVPFTGGRITKDELLARCDALHTSIVSSGKPTSAEPMPSPLPGRSRSDRPSGGWVTRLARRWGRGG